MSYSVICANANRLIQERNTNKNYIITIYKNLSCTSQKSENPTLAKLYNIQISIQMQCPFPVILHTMLCNIRQLKMEHAWSYEEDGTGNTFLFFQPNSIKLTLIDV